mmetsp:Transcript_2613/g.2899  ORF Transcript_2613/g.2899 Transcript_2613/m.2899 type:complete len:92 (-) Transcript_2613:312-587(-)
MLDPVSIGCFVVVGGTVLVGASAGFGAKRLEQYLEGRRIRKIEQFTPRFTLDDLDDLDDDEFASATPLPNMFVPTSAPDIRNPLLLSKRSS